MVVRRRQAQPYKLPNPTEEYDRRYMDQMISQVELILNAFEQPDILKGSRLYLDLNSLPTGGVGLRPGMVWREGSVLHIVLEEERHLGTFNITTNLGTLTVTTS